MRSILLVLAIIINLSIYGQSCGDGAIFLNSQADVDNFASNYPGCTTVEGNLFIEGQITDLSGLSQLTRINGFLRVQSSFLTSLDGLDNLIEVTDEYRVYDCPMLTDISALSNFTKMYWLTIENCDAITNLNALSNLSTVEISLRISNNDSIENLQGLENLENVSGTLSFSGAGITSLQGLQNLESIGKSFAIFDCPLLTNFEGVTNLTSVAVNFIVSNNNSLENFIGLESLEYIGRAMEISGNNSLVDFTGLSNLTTIEGLGNSSESHDVWLLGNDSLKNFNGLNNLEVVGGQIRIDDNDMLENFVGLVNIDSINGPIILNGNTSFDSLAGLDSLTNLDALIIGNGNGFQEITDVSYPNLLLGYFAMVNNNSVQGITNFQVGNLSELRIDNNSALTQLTGFDQAENVYTSIEENENLNFVELYKSTDALGATFIFENPKITELKIAEQATLLNSTFNINGNSSMTSISSMSNVLTASSILIINNIALERIDQFPNLQNVTHSFEISDNDSLEEIINLENIATINDNFLIQRNEQLSLIEPLNQLQIIGEDFKVEENLLLSNFPEIQQLDEIGGELSITDNHLIQNLNGLNSLELINGPLNINRNDNLLDIKGLSNLTSLGGGYFQVDGNALLISLEGVENIDPESVYSISMQENPNLEICNNEFVCAFLENNQNYTFHHINDNAPGCNHATTVAENCGFVLGLEDIIVAQLEIYPNPTKASLNLNKTISGTITIYNLLGQEMLNRDINSNSIDVTAFPNGMYFLYISSEENGTARFKFLKE